MKKKRFYIIWALIAALILGTGIFVVANWVKEIPYDTAEILKNLTAKGYEVVTNDFDSEEQKPVFGNHETDISNTYKHAKQ